MLDGEHSYDEICCTFNRSYSEVDSVFRYGSLWCALLYCSQIAFVSRHDPPLKFTEPRSKYGLCFDDDCSLFFNTQIYFLIFIDTIFVNILFSVVFFIYLRPLLGEGWKERFGSKNGWYLCKVIKYKLTFQGCHFCIDLFQRLCGFLEEMERFA